MLLSQAIPMFSVEAAPRNADAELVARSLRGDADAFGELVARHQVRVFRLAGRVFRQRDEVEDVAQETFLRAWTKLATWRGDAPFEHWLTRLCLRCAYDRLRRQRLPAETREIELETEPQAISSDPDARLEVERLLARLKPADRLVLLLLEGEGWSVAEIAARLGWTQVNVKVRAHRARKSLRRWVEEQSAPRPAPPG